MLGIVQADPPDGNDWLPVLVQVARIARHLQSIHQVVPILLESVEQCRRVCAADIVLNRKYAPVLQSGRHDVLENDIPGSIVSRNVRYKALDQDAIQPVVLHPFKMPGHRLAVPCREQICGRAAYRHVGHRAGLASFELPGVGIHVNRDRCRSRDPAARPVAPVRSRSAAAWTAEPSLVTQQHFPLQSRWIYGLCPDPRLQQHGARKRKQNWAKKHKCTTRDQSWRYFGRGAKGLAGTLGSGLMSPWNIRVISPATLKYQSLGNSEPSASSVSQKP